MFVTIRTSAYYEKPLEVFGKRSDITWQMLTGSFFVLCEESVKDYEWKQDGQLKSYFLVQKRDDGGLDPKVAAVK